MACVGHLVTEATIGREDDLGLDSSFGYSKWRAMIIKDNEGDWALCAAAWKGMKAGTSFKSFYRLPLGKSLLARDKLTSFLVTTLLLGSMLYSLVYYGSNNNNCSVT